MLSFKHIPLRLQGISSPPDLLQHILKLLVKVRSHKTAVSNLDACIDMLSSLRMSDEDLPKKTAIGKNEAILMHVFQPNETTDAVKNTLLTLVAAVNSRCEEMQEPALIYLLMRADPPLGEDQVPAT